MINRVEPSAVNPQAVIQNALAPALAKTPATQVFPAQSVLELAQSELGPDASRFDLMPSPIATESGAAFTETAENMGFTLGSQMRGRSRNITEKADRARPRALLHRLIKQIAVPASQLEDLYRRGAGFETVDDLGAALRECGLDAGEMALLLASLLAQGGLARARRKRLEDALDAVMDDEEWALQLFSHLEFGGTAKSGLAELRRLYQRAATRQPGLMHWFAQFRQLRDRKRKLKTLIRTLAFELSADGGALDLHLAALITDLKRILQFLGMEDHCNRVARSLPIPDLDGDRVLEELLEIIQQPWVYPDWLAGRTDRLVPDEDMRHGFARRMADLVKLLPDDCFDDGDQRASILTAFSEYREKLADQAQ